MAALAAVPCLGCACCAASSVCSCCCSASSAVCVGRSRGSKLLYPLIILFAAVLGIVLRYHGEAALAGWVSSMRVCQDGACWGLQSNYRISGATTGFFAFMTLFTAVYPPTHVGAWAIKIAFYILLLGLSLLINNDFFTTYAEIARYASIVFIVIQMIVVVDFAYVLHEMLIGRIELSEERATTRPTSSSMQAARNPYAATEDEQGVCASSPCCPACWKITYLLLCFICIVGSIVAIGFFFRYFGDCTLMQFFIAQTLVVGIVFLILSVLSGISRGLLIPSVLFAYNTYFLYGALTNNPDVACNRAAASETSNRAAIISGLALTILSVTWASYSSAGSIVKASKSGSSSISEKNAPPPPPEEDDVEVGRSGSSAGLMGGVTSTGAPKAASGMGDGPKPSTTAAAPSAYADVLPTPAEHAPGKKASGMQPLSIDRTPATSSPIPSSTTAISASEATAPLTGDTKPWLFHIVMMFAGLYLAMLLTNWGDQSKISQESGSTERSLSSMWVRIVSQWIVYALYTWTLFAAKCCPNRDFS